MTDQKQSPLFTVVLTGGIASGKSAAADCFANLGIPVIDTDIIARQVVAPGSSGLQQVITAFGDSILTIDHELDRRELRKIIFQDDAKRERLEAILHPLIESEAKHQLRMLEQQADRPAYAIIAVPLYTETETFRWADRILLIDTSAEIQLQRLLRRDRITNALAQQMLSAQADRQTRLKLADDVISNTGTLEDLSENCRKIHQRYLTLASWS